VLAGSFKSGLPALSCCFIESGKESESTLSPADSAALGPTPAPTPPFFSPASALCSCSEAPQ
jgi:hypothetical protein